METKECRVCGKENEIDIITVKERMLGTNDEFLYFQCPECDCLQINETPKNLSDYYPKNYYSYKKVNRLINAPIRKWVDTHRVNHLTGNSNIPGMFLDRISKSLEYIPWIQHTKVKRDASILDVGCGQGRLLLRMALGGFSNLTGIDPFLEEDITYPNGIKVIKTSIDDFAQGKLQYDIIMLHHSLEHIPEQDNTFKNLARLLAPGGTIIIRIPLADSYAWEHYREHWVQLDAPRHLYLHSKKSLAILTEKNELHINDTVYDSDTFQFTGSELYLKDIPLNSDKKTRKIFSEKQLAIYKEKSIELNQDARGDQAVFYINKSTKK